MYLYTDLERIRATGIQRSELGRCVSTLESNPLPVCPDTLRTDAIARPDLPPGQKSHCCRASVRSEKRLASRPADHLLHSADDVRHVIVADPREEWQCDQALKDGLGGWALPGSRPQMLPAVGVQVDRPVVYAPPIFSTWSAWKIVARFWRSRSRFKSRG